MKISGPLFKWFGSKWLSSKTLPAPRHSLIIEPFAGGAGYSLRHFTKTISIWDEDPNLQVLWPWLLRAKEADVREIPIDMPSGTDIRSLGLSLGQAMLVKHWQRTNNVGDTWHTSPWGHLPGQWTANTRARVASEVEAIAHWRFERPEWKTEYATFFLDPPYLYNYRYRSGFAKFNHDGLADIVRYLIPGSSQVIVCEAVCQKTQACPVYLPFELFGNRITSRRKANENHHSKELIYTR